MTIVSLPSRRSRILAALVIAQACSIFPVAHAKDWTKAVPLTTPGIDIANPSLALSDDGTAVAVWVEGNADTSSTPVESIRYAIKLPTQKKFAAAQVLFAPGNPNGIPSHIPTVAIDGAGNAIIVWLHRPGSVPSFAGDDVLLYAVKPAGATTFGAPQQLPRTGPAAGWTHAFEYDVAANQAGVFWIVNRMSPPAPASAGQRIVSWRGTIAGFGEPEFASARTSDALSDAGEPIVSVTPDGGAYLSYELPFGANERVFVNFHNGARWFFADETPNFVSGGKGIPIGFTGDSQVGTRSAVVATSDGGALYAFREGRIFGLFTRATNWTLETSGFKGSVNATPTEIAPFSSNDSDVTPACSAAVDSKGNGLLVAGATQSGSKLGLTYTFASPSGLGASKFLKSPANEAASLIAVDMDPAGNAVMAFGVSSSSLNKTLYLAYRGAGATKNFKIEDKIVTAKGLDPRSVSIGLAPKNRAVALFLGRDKLSRKVVYYSTRTNKNPPKKRNANRR